MKRISADKVTRPSITPRPRNCIPKMDAAKTFREANQLAVILEATDSLIDLHMMVGCHNWKLDNREKLSGLKAFAVALMYDVAQSLNGPIDGVCRLAAQIAVNLTTAEYA